MDLFIVGIIVLAAVCFTVKSIVNIYTGKGDCGCGSCSQDCCGTPDKPFRKGNHCP